MDASERQRQVQDLLKEALGYAEIVENDMFTFLLALALQEESRTRKDIKVADN